MKVLTHLNFTTNYNGMRSINQLIVCLLITIFCGLPFSTLQAQSLLFEHLTVKDGLSQSTVNSIYQDESGMMWIGTKDGLNKYNGNEFEVFKPVKGDTTGLFGNNIQTVCGDRKGHLFVQCLWGLIDYDLKSQEFKTVTSKGIVTISYGLNHLWAGKENSIWIYDQKTASLKLHYSFGAETSITAVHEVYNGNLIIGTTKGLLLLDKNKKIKTLIADIEVVCLFSDSKKNLWIGSLNDGLYKINSNAEITNYRHDKSDPTSITANFVRAVCEDNLGNYWIGTSNGLNKLVSGTEQFISFKHLANVSHSLGSSSIWDIKKDQQGTLWIGTYFGGVDILNPEFSFYKYYNTGTDGLSSSVIGHMTEDKDGNVWICTEGGGLNFLNIQTGQISSYQSSSLPQSISSNILKAIWYDRDNDCLWIGTHLGGLNKFDIKTKSFKRYSATYAGLKSIRSLVHYQNKFYLGTKSGIFVFDRAKETFYPILQDSSASLTHKQIWNIMIDRNGNLWFSTSVAVFKYNLEKGTLKAYTHISKNTSGISQNYQQTFFQDQKGRIWLGSAGSGLSLYNSKSDTFTSFNTGNSEIIDDYILDITESKMGYLLIATNKGLSRFDIDNKKFYNYYNGNIFPFTAINERGLFVSKKGNLFIGGINGMVELNEEDLDFVNKPYTIGFSDLWVNNQRVLPFDKTGILDKSISYTDTITLNQNHTSVQLSFFTSNYIKILKEEVLYKLEGFDKEWIHANNRNIITYTNLSPGTYHLRIKGKSPNAKEALLSIVVKPAFYKTWLAYVIYFLIFSGICYAILSSYISKTKLQASLKYSHKEKQKIQELNDAKLRFFTNISHEFRTPITLIMSQAELIFQTENISKSVFQKLKSISSNATKMHRLIGELMDFSKQEQGFLKLKVSPLDITSFIENICAQFKEYAYSKEINLYFEETSPIFIWFDPAQLEKVFYNLIHNALKYTPAKGVISVRIEQTAEQVYIFVKDTGIGMDDDVSAKVFDVFYQADVKDDISGTGTGIGLSLAKGIVEAHHGSITVASVPNEGSEFKIALLKGEDHFTAPQKQLQEVMLTENTNDFSEETQRQAQEDTPVVVSSKKASILIVEDNKELLDVLVSIFKPIYTVNTAPNGREGLEKIMDIQPDIVLSDVMMPEMSGTELCHQIKTNVTTCHIPVILLTARTSEEHTLEGLQLGADDYITKPFNAKLLIAKCHNLINNRRLLQAKFSKSTSAETSLIATNPYDEQLLQKAIEIIENNINNPQLDVNFFAQEMNLGRTNLFAKIKGITGQTPNEFILNIRLKKSLIMLKENPNLTISEIAYQTGFNEPAYFIKCFKKTFGLTPTQYRKKD
ncbi:hybrid sensor histidine kinase/response regulator transcription factor [Pseudopedobacter beijingensis]|uniref:histidine kinase n=1 Tax=Pseudopedobacter beijingensis TaxID=1207056 RepID=A0ABW4IBN4_9SPHI